MTPTPKTVAGLSPRQPVRLIVKKELLRTSTPVVYDGKRLNDAIDRLTGECLFLFSVGGITAVIGLLMNHRWLAGIGFTVGIIGGYGFNLWIKEWSSNTETVVEQLYVELPPGIITTTSQHRRK